MRRPSPAPCRPCRSRWPISIAAASTTTTSAPGVVAAAEQPQVAARSTALSRYSGQVSSTSQAGGGLVERAGGGDVPVADAALGEAGLHDLRRWPGWRAGRAPGSGRRPRRRPPRPSPAQRRDQQHVDPLQRDLGDVGQRAGRGVAPERRGHLGGRASRAADAAVVVRPGAARRSDQPAATQRRPGTAPPRPAPGSAASRPASRAGDHAQQLGQRPARSARAGRSGRHVR